MLGKTRGFQFRLITLLALLAGMTAIAAHASTDTSVHNERASGSTIADSSAGSALCGSSAYAQTTLPPSPEVLAWTSHEVVIGTVTEKLAPVWGDPIMTGSAEEFEGKSIRIIYTEYAVDVEERIRGREHDVIRTRIPGGTIGDCTIQSDAVQVAEGDRVLLFLSGQVESHDDRPGPAYYLTHVKTGVWDFIEGQDVAPRVFVEAADVHGPAASGPLEHFTRSWPESRSSMRDSLRSGELPPGDSTHGVPRVPLEAAPVRDS